MRFAPCRRWRTRSEAPWMPWLIRPASASPPTSTWARSLFQARQMCTRLRIFYLSMDTQADVPLLKERVLNTFPDFGDDMMRGSGIGEFASNWPLFGSAMPSNYEAALTLVAKQGWAFQQHSLSPAEDQLTIKTFEAVNALTRIAALRWSIAHVPRID